MATKKIVEAPKKEHPQKALTNVLMRIVAVFAASGLSVLGAGAVVGIDTIRGFWHDLYCCIKTRRQSLHGGRSWCV